MSMSGESETLGCNKGTVAVLGSGAFGTAMAVVLANAGYAVKLWCHESKSAETIMREHSNTRYLPDVVLPRLITASDDLQAIVNDVTFIFEAIPVAYLRDVLRSAKPFITSKHMFIILSKGIEARTCMLPYQILEDVVGPMVQSATMAGPSFASDIARGEAAGLMLACSDRVLSDSVRSIFRSTSLFLHDTQDVAGVSMVAALKNVVAIGVGVLEGAGESESTKIFFLMRALEEIKYFLTRCGGQELTVYSLAGIGDLMMTAMGRQSRNRRLGVYLGQGLSCKEACERIGGIPEGVNTCVSVDQMIKAQRLLLPVLQGIVAVVAGILAPEKLSCIGIKQH